MIVVLCVIVAVYANKRLVKLNEKHAVNHRCTYCNLLLFYAGPYEYVRFGRQWRAYRYWRTRAALLSCCRPVYDRRAWTLIGKPSKRERNRVTVLVVVCVLPVFAVTVCGRGGIEFFHFFFPRPENATRVLFASRLSIETRRSKTVRPPTR